MRIEKVGMTPLSFGKKLEEHRSWGARVATDDNKKEKLVINLRNIFTRSELTEQELNTLYGIINYLDK